MRYHASRRIASSPSQIDRSPDVPEHTRLLKFHPHHHAHIYPMSRRNSRKSMRVSPCCEMRPDPLALLQNNSMFQLKQEWSIEFLDGTQECPQEHSHKSRGTMRSSQQKERAPCTTNELDMRAGSLALTQEECQLSTSNSRGGFSQI